MKIIATICVALGALGIVLGVITRFIGPVIDQGPRVLASGSALFLLLAIALLLLEKKAQ